MNDRIIKVEYEDDELETLYCPMCSKVGISSVLGPKILMPNEERQLDYENWLQCVKCSWLCPIYEAEPIETIQDTVTTIDNPFEESKGQVLAAFKKGTRARRKNKKQEHHKDPDINLEIKQHDQDNVKVIQDTNS